MKILKQLVPEDNLTMSRSTTHSSTDEREYTKPIIPVDLLIDIFSRLPLKHVARFRCLSKSWASILGSPYFTELFLTKSSNRPRLLFTVNSYGKLFFFSTPQITQNPHANSSVVATWYKTHPWKRHERTSSLLHGRLSTAAYSNTNRAWVLTLETGKLLWRMIECKYHYVMFRDPTYTHRHMICIDGVLYYLACINIIDISHSTDFAIVCFDVKSEKFSFINIDDESMYRGGSTLINYKGRLGVVQFTDYERTLCLWLLEDAAGINKWSTNIYELPLSWKHPCTENFQIVGMTRTCDIVLSPCKFSDPFYVFYYNVERKTLARTEIQGLQGLQELKCDRPLVYIFPDYVEDLRLMESLF
ncbi:hypothetical protein F2Q70_00007679 [Brassica cretica]|uniref:F-box domain-containing protein n=1 Tax=Brassica cretica TaxID=69181 RepID=A0A8S9M616_BRACR|nr:hypothetical protein F2Q70_00007679 [Brassica cretica]KAF3546396.1 hypothetical protein DY000_02000883 [Brassica cretica]